MIIIIHVIMMSHFIWKSIFNFNFDTERERERGGRERERERERETLNFMLSCVHFQSYS